MKCFVRIAAFTLLIPLSWCIFDNEINLECKGKHYENVTLTAYYPDYDDVDNVYAYRDKKGTISNLLNYFAHSAIIWRETVECADQGDFNQMFKDYLDDRIHYVTLSMDPNLHVPYGTPVCIPELNLHFGHRIRLEVRDSSSDLEGTGFTRAEICVRTETDSYDITVNRFVTLVFET